MDIIVRETNREASRVYIEWNNAHPDNPKQWTAITVIELKAFLGLLITAGVGRAKFEPLTELWSASNGRPFFSAVMSMNRFKNILRFLRFDNKQTRPERRATDKLAAIRDVWVMFIAKLQKAYIPGVDMTVDEQLVPFRGRCPFRQYMPSKPAKYGIKIWWNCCSESCYPLKGEIYLGRQPDEERQIGLGASVVMNTVEPWLRTGRNVVCDNFFTSIPLAEELLHEHTTLVGTLRSNKGEIPPEMMPNRNRPEHSSLFGFADNLTIASYVPKKGKAVVLLSTLHHEDKTEGDKAKPEIILHYNEKKSGVDNMDHLATIFSVKRKTNRWPMAVFYNMVDVAGIAAFVIWISLNPNWMDTKKKLRRRVFLQTLGHELCEEYLCLRIQNHRVLTKSVRLSLKLIGKDVAEPAMPAVPERQQTRKRCRLCPARRDVKTSQVCNKCNRMVCSNHSSKVVTITCEDCE